MNTDRQQHIAHLLHRFFDGQSTLEEENELSMFFKEEQVPREWSQYKRMFDYIESLQPQPNMKHTHRKRSVWLKRLSVAAILALLFMGMRWLYSSPSATPQQENRTASVDPAPSPSTDTLEMVTVAPPTVNLAQVGDTHHKSKPHRSVKVKKQLTVSDSVEIIHTQAELEKAEQEYIADQMLLEEELRCSHSGARTQSGWITTSLNIQ